MLLFDFRSGLSLPSRLKLVTAFTKRFLASLKRAAMTGVLSGQTPPPSSAQALSETRKGTDRSYALAASTSSSNHPMLTLFPVTVTRT